MNAELIVSVSGIRDTTRDAAIEFAGEMDARGVRLSLLVAPRLKGKYRLVDDPATQSWLRGRRLEAEAAPGIVYTEIDGEPLGTLPASYEIVPGAITLVGTGA
jgi:predicted deacetylase